MSGEKVELAKGLTIRALIIGAALSVVLSVLMTIGAYTISHHFSGTAYVVGASNSPSPFNLFWCNGLWVMLLLILVTSPLPKRLRLTKQELTVILTMCIITIPLVTNWSEVAYAMTFAPESIAGGGALYTVGGEADVLVKWWQGWLTRIDAYPTSKNQYVNGGWLGRPINVVLPYPFEKYLPMFVWHWGQIITLGLLCIFVAAILRRQYVDIEALPFPNAVAAVTLINEATEVDGKVKIFRDKWFWLGFAVAQIMVLPGYIYILGSRLGFDTTWWQFNTAAKYDLIIPYMPLTFVWVAPWFLGFGTLMPTDFLISFFITWLVFIVGIANIEWMIGMFTPPPSNANMAWYVARIRDNLIILNPAGVGLNAVAYGIMIAAAVYPLWVHRRHVVTTIRALWRKPPTEVEEKEALPYRWLYVGAILSFIGYLICFAITPAVGVLWLMIPFLILTVFWWIGGARFIATVGGGGRWSEQRMGFNAIPNGWAARTALFSLYGKPTVQDALSGRVMLYAHYIHGVQGYWTMRSANSMPMPIVLDCFKVASVTGTRTRDILIAAIIGLLIPVFIAGPLRSSMNYWATWRVGPGQNSWCSEDAGWVAVIAARGEPYGWRDAWYIGYPVGNPWPDVPGVTTLILIGLVIGVVCFWLKSRFSWFIYTPFAIVFWASELGGELWWFLLLIALIIKLIVIRTFGVLFYEEKIVPLATGLIIGGMLYMTIDFTHYWFTGRVFV